MHVSLYTPWKFNRSPLNNGGWLEDDVWLPIGCFGNFSGAFTCGKNFEDVAFVSSFIYEKRIFSSNPQKTLSFFLARFKTKKNSWKLAPGPIPTQTYKYTYIIYHAYTCSRVATLAGPSTIYIYI